MRKIKNTKTISLLVFLLAIFAAFAIRMYWSVISSATLKVILPNPGPQAIGEDSKISVKAMAITGEFETSLIDLSITERVLVARLISSPPTYPRGQVVGGTANHLLGTLNISPNRSYMIFDDGSIGISSVSMVWKNSAVSEVMLNTCKKSREKAVTLQSEKGDITK